MTSPKPTSRRPSRSITSRPSRSASVPPPSSAPSPCQRVFSRPIWGFRPSLLMKGAPRPRPKVRLTQLHLGALREYLRTPRVSPAARRPSAAPGRPFRAPAHRPLDPARRVRRDRRLVLSHFLPPKTEEMELLRGWLPRPAVPRGKMNDLSDTRGGPVIQPYIFLPPGLTAISIPRGTRSPAVPFIFPLGASGRLGSGGAFTVFRS